MNKRIRKKVVRNFISETKAPDGLTLYAHVNRRGCKGRWTEKDQAALNELVLALHRQFASGRVSPETET